MNNLRLLTGSLCVAAVCLGADVCGQSVMSLEQLFEVAEGHSVRLRPLYSARQEAEKEIDVAKASRLPDIGLAMSVSFIGDGFTTARDYSDFQKAPIPHLGTGLSLNVEQPLYTGGAVTAGIELARMKARAADYSLDAQRDDIRFRLAGLYLDLYRYHNLLHVVDANIVAAEKVLDEMTKRFEGGVALRNDITRYELLLENLRVDRIRLENTLSILNEELVSTAGLPEKTVVVPDTTILERSMSACALEEWKEEALVSSPRLRLASNGVGMSREAEKIVRAEKLPKVGLKASWTIDGPILVEVPPIDRNLSYWWVGLGVSYNLSSLYKSDKSLAKSRIATRKAEEEYVSAVNDIETELHSDYVRYLESFEELKAREKGVELAERNYATTSFRYSSDMALITDMLDATNARIDAEQQLVNARINIIFQYYKLLFTSGKI